MNNDHKNNKNKNSNNNEKNENKVLIDYFNSMYIDCINNKNINHDNQCDFIKEKINSLTQTQKPDNSKLRHHIIFAVAK
jgi:hypothetical protein